MRKDYVQAPKDSKLRWFSLLVAASAWLTFAQRGRRSALARMFAEMTRSREKIDLRKFVFWLS